MTIAIGQQDHYGYKVLRDGIEIGYTKRFCCGVDFIPAGGYGPDKRLIFSILNLKEVTDSRLIDCIDEITRLDLDHLNGHFNYKHLSQRKKTFEEVKSDFDKIAMQQRANK